MTTRRKPRVYEEGPGAARNAEGTMRQILGVSREELAKREAEYQESRRNKVRPGPKPKR